MIYLDNAATSWPKPPEVKQAMNEFMESVGGNPGRSGHRLSIDAARVLYNTRELIATLFNAPDPLKVIFTLNATHALNYAIHGLLKTGDSVIIAPMQHNSVMRPLRMLERTGIKLIMVPSLPDGTLQIQEMEKLFDTGIKMVVVNHASNVTGTIFPLNEIAVLTRKYSSLLLVDAAQTAGIIPIDIQAEQIDLLAFTGHKGLLGPTGTGGLIIGNRVNISEFSPILQGGTGSRSEYETHPEDIPDKFEFGTPNIAGIAGLNSGINWITERNIESIKMHEIKLGRILIDGLTQIPGLKIHGPTNINEKLAVTSFTIRGKEVSDIGLALDEEFDILCRVGLHCAPSAHRSIGTFPTGTVRLAPGIFNTENEIYQVIDAINKIAIS